MAAKKNTIDFLPKEEWEKTPFGKFLKWALTVGRHIVIATELVVILAFLSRFKLDRDLTDLHEEIKRKQAIVQASAQFESEFRFVQKQLATLKNLKKKQEEAVRVLNELSPFLPGDVYLSYLSSSKEELSLRATALSPASLATFLANLESSSRFAELEVSQVRGKEKGGIEVELKGRLVSQNEIEGRD